MNVVDLNSVDVAAYIAKQAVIKNYYIDLTKLQKILYACYGTYLAVTGKRLCIDQLMHGKMDLFFQIWRLHA